MTLLFQAHIRRRFSLSQLPLHLPTKPSLISAQVALLCLLSLPVSPCQGCSNSPQSDDKNIQYSSSPPTTPAASHSASTSLASLVSPQTPPDAHGPAFCWQIQVRLGPLSSFTSMVQDLF